MSIKIIIDSASDISPAEAKQLGVEMISLQITFCGNDYYDGVDLTPQKFYEMLVETDDLPKTSQISPFRFATIFDKALKEYDEVLVITLSSKLSNTYNSAVLASQEFEGKVFVVDSLNATLGERLVCLRALEMAKAGMCAKDIKDVLDQEKHEINVIAVVDTLEYLQKGGRISKATAIVGEIFSFKPVIAVIDGEVKSLGKARGSKRANNLLCELVAEKGIDFTRPYGTIYSGLSDIFLDKYIKDSAHLWEKDTTSVPKYILGCTIGTHVGPGAVGVAFFSKKK